jgi:hypothetical protein
MTTRMARPRPRIDVVQGPVVTPYTGLVSAVAAYLRDRAAEDIRRMDPTLLRGGGTTSAVATLAIP